MKHILFFSLMFLSFFSALAGENDWYVTPSGHVLFNPTSRVVRYGASMSLEKQIGGHKHIEVALLATGYPNSNLFKESELIMQGYYKPLLSLGKNSYGAVKFGPNLGFGSLGFLFGLGVGFEYDVVLHNGLKLYISQDNLLVFRGDDRFSSGLSAGIRLPL